MVWEDGLHFTAVGYDLMGRLIAGRLAELMEDERQYQLEENQRPLRASRKKLGW